MACSPTSITIGTTPAFELLFYNLDGELESPLSLSVVHREPDGTETTYTTSDAEVLTITTGTYRVVLPAATQVGRHRLYVTGSGSTTVATQTVTFRVRNDGIDTF